MVRIPLKQTSDVFVSDFRQPFPGSYLPILIRSNDLLISSKGCHTDRVSCGRCHSFKWYNPGALDGTACRFEMHISTGCLILVYKSPQSLVRNETSGET